MDHSLCTQLNIGVPVSNVTSLVQSANFTNISPGSWHLALYSDEANSAQQFLVTIEVTSTPRDTRESLTGWMDAHATGLWTL